jgi:hypothetical protein
MDFGDMSHADVGKENLKPRMSQGKCLEWGTCLGLNSSKEGGRKMRSERSWEILGEHLKAERFFWFFVFFFLVIVRKMQQKNEGDCKHRILHC